MGWATDVSQWMGQLAEPSDGAVAPRNDAIRA
jgi:hypothetical protein